VVQVLFPDLQAWVSNGDDGWHISDALWEKMSHLLPVHILKHHPLGCHRRRVDDRAAMNAIVFVLRTGCQLVCAQCDRDLFE